MQVKSLIFSSEIESDGTRACLMCSGTSTMMAGKNRSRVGGWERPHQGWERPHHQTSTVTALKSFTDCSPTVDVARLLVLPQAAIKLNSHFFFFLLRFSDISHDQQKKKKEKKKWIVCFLQAGVYLSMQGLTIGTGLICFWFISSFACSCNIKRFCIFHFKESFCHSEIKKLDFSLIYSWEL